MPEPAPGGIARFVIHKHRATTLHYDLRIEAGGVLVSWAVPKGPSLDPAAKRLAVHVGDHDLDHVRFEEPGSKIVWDEGTYRSLTDGSVADAVAAGHLSVWFEGTKLRGGWSLTRTRSGPRETWILVKRSDEHADPDVDPTVSAPFSTVTGRALFDVGDPPAGGFVAPMLASVGAAGDPARSARPEEWTYERKLDGLRGIAVVAGGEAHLWSRNQLPFDRRFPAVLAALRALPVDDVVLDGELVAFDGERTSFAGLQRGIEGARLAYVVFDVLHLLGRDVTGLALSARRELLAKLLADPPPPITVVAGVGGGSGDDAELLAGACADGWEGLIAKRLAAPYRSGRSRDWQKLVCSASQELIIVGWTEPRRSRTGFGALLLAYYDDDGLLRYAGKVGTGFDDAALRSLRARMEGLAVERPPVAERVPDRVVHWIRPELVAAVTFKEWTADGRLRHPSFAGLRDDKAARDVRRERR